VFYRGSHLGSREFARIQRLVDTRPGLTREALAREIARRFRWRRPDGHLAVSSCRLLLGRLARRGWLRLPASRRAGNAGAPASAGPVAEPDAPQVITAVNGPVVVRPVVPAEAPRWRRDVGRYHYLGAAPLVGETLRYVALAGDEPVAWLGWAAAALYNPPRDRYLGWDPSTRRRRLPWVVNNVRFLILPWVHVPNLASRILAVNLRRLVRDWHAVYGHQVLLAETFVDATRFRGTCYRASNWRYVGDTLGFSRRGAHYTPNGRPKHVFVYPLGPRARERLRAPELERPPTREDAAMVTLDVRRLPLDGRGGLIELLRGLTDPRQPRGRRHSLVSIMAIAVGATLAGAQSLMAIAHWAADQSAPTLRRLGCRGRVPSEATLRRVLGRVDIRALDARVGGWLAQQAPLAGQALAIDGKSLRGSAQGDTKAVHLVSAVLHREAVIVAQHRVADKTNEISSPTPLFAPLDITGAVVTADAMFTQTAIATHLVEDKHADYLFTVKDNQPTLRQDIEDLHLQGAFPPSARHV
jgi:Domain of unknown function (DUF4338)/DDE_Tnp_1-associated/Transposase DDE domain